MKEPNWNNIENIFKYTTLGNLARPTQQCGYSNLKSDFLYGIKERSPEVILQCDKGEYISKIMSFGLLYLDDKQTGSKSSGYTECSYINNPNTLKDKWVLEENLELNEDEITWAEI